ncbi:MAG: hypothetical protein KA956_02420 [Pyrinomonadaceae bacterium]|nr:hypothetical protein [Acidobacteriota bacterium]MBK7932253.1 hypothetical protein [Acidobacteriota bacterium]MBP7375312.1 hypothetical protein [Pyrinomonadaceae bacterium]
MRILIAITAVWFLASANISFAQEMPAKIRGYKVHNAKIQVRSSEDKQPASTDREAVITLGELEVADYGISGITLSAGARISPVDHSGRVEFLTFRDFRINGIAVDIEEYKHEFSFKKGEQISLPKPARVFVGTLNLARAARSALLDPKKKWSVTGTVFVFGKFKKFGMSFKRVVPIKIDLTIANPLN